MEYLYEHLSLTDKALVDREEVADGLEQLGYRLTGEELERLLDQLDPGNTGKVAKTQVAASQIDWRVLQQSQTERWLQCACAAFSTLDMDGDGFISGDEMVAMLRNKLPAEEVEVAVRHALQEAARRSEGSLRGPRSEVDGATHADDTQHSVGSAEASVRDGMTFRQVRPGCQERSQPGPEWRRACVRSHATAPPPHLASPTPAPPAVCAHAARQCRRRAPGPV